jgi:hypothetical protein
MTEPKKITQEHLAVVNKNFPNVEVRAWLRHYHSTGEKLACEIDGVLLTAEQMEERAKKLGAKI